MPPREKLPRRAASRLTEPESEHESGDESEVYHPGKDDGESESNKNAQDSESSVGVPEDLDPPPKDPPSKRVKKNVVVAGRSQCPYCPNTIHRQTSNIARHLEIHQGKGIQIGNKEQIKAIAKRIFNNSKASQMEAQIRHNCKLREAQPEQDITRG